MHCGSVAIADAEQFIDHKHLKMGVSVGGTAEPVHEAHGAKPGVVRCFRAVVAGGVCDRSEEYSAEAADRLKAWQ